MKAKVVMKCGSSLFLLRLGQTGSNMTFSFSPTWKYHFLKKSGNSAMEFEIIPRKLQNTLFTEVLQNIIVYSLEGPCSFCILFFFFFLSCLFFSLLKFILE